MEIYTPLFIGLVGRLGLLLYGEWQDQTMAVKFTDIDYHVFTDAAAYVVNGESPYQRATYRYTPLLAWVLQPNILLTASFGKLLFILLDIFTGYLIYRITLSSGSSSRFSSLCAATWLLNPLPMTVSSRGNAESIMTFLVLLSLKLIQDRRQFFAGLVYGLSVHFKIYPVIYAIPIYLYINYEDGSARKFSWRSLLPTRDRLLFIFSAATVFFSVTLFYYRMYGMEFLQHTYLYHVTRKDIRHNFSVYFYLLYQQSAMADSLLMALLAFAPQVVLLLVFSFKFFNDLPLVFFLNTMAFVTFNKVCTSQYFLWYLCILPLLLPNLHQITGTRAAAVISLWCAGQGIWLLPAYYLEFEGVNTYFALWCAGVFFFLVNCYIMYTLIDVYSPGRGNRPKRTAGKVHYSKTTEYSKDFSMHTSKPRFLKQLDVDYDTRASLYQGENQTSPSKHQKTSVKTDLDSSPSYRLRSKRKT